MEIQQLRYLVAVANTRSFTRAARDCHVTQPTLSHQIKKLEEEIGEPLLQRFKKGAFLTPLGQRIFIHAANVLETLEAARQEASSFSGKVQGALRIGVIPTVAPYLLPRLLRTCQKRHPGIVFQITEDPTDHLLAALRRGALDLALLSPPLVGEDLLHQDLFEDELLLVLPAAHPLNHSRSIRLQDLHQFPMIVMNEAHCLRGQTLSFCDRAGFAPKVLIQSSQIDTILALVEAGLGISLIPALARASARERKVVFRSIRPEKPSRRISLAWPRQLSPSKAFTAFQKICASIYSRNGPAGLPEKF
jgi:LysR family hydrogen peroxide-inducible transcriptional activator